MRAGSWFYWVSLLLDLTLIMLLRKQLQRYKHQRRILLDLNWKSSYFVVFQLSYELSIKSSTNYLT